MPKSAQRHCLVVDLHNDEGSIWEYEHYHRPGNVWPGVLESIRDSGISEMCIHRFEDRLVMIINADEGFSISEKALNDAQNPIVEEWETLMNRYQKLSSNTDERAKWCEAPLIFRLSDHL